MSDGSGKWLLRVVAMGLLLGLGVGISYAQEGEAVPAEEAARDEFYFSYGKVEQATKDEVVVIELDEATNQENRQTFVINERTHLQGITSGADLQPGSFVYIDYVVADGQNRAIWVELDADDSSEEELE